MKARILIVLSLAAVCAPTGRAQPQPIAQHVIFVTLDGMRWQEFFSGANREYFRRDRTGDGGAPERRFWRETGEERRRTLMPFVWSMMAANGRSICGTSCRCMLKLSPCMSQWYEVTLTN